MSSAGGDKVETVTAILDVSFAAGIATISGRCAHPQCACYPHLDGGKGATRDCEKEHGDVV